MSTTHSSQGITVHSAESAWWKLGIIEIWHHRKLLTFLVWRDIKIRYKQTVIGSFWILLQPILEMVVLTIIFGDFFKRTSTGLPYPLFVYSGLVPWTTFSNCVSSAAGSILGNADLIKKTYFPRVMVPLSVVIGKGVDFCMACIVLSVLMAYYQVPLDQTMLLIPVAVILLLLLTSALSLLLATTQVFYRDIALLIPYFLRLGMFLTPVIYPVTIVSPQWQWILNINPMTGILQAFRAGILHETVDWNVLAWSGICGVLLMCIALIVFRRNERTILDIL